MKPPLCSFGNNLPDYGRIFPLDTKSPDSTPDTLRADPPLAVRALLKLYPARQDVSLMTDRLRAVFVLPNCRAPDLSRYRPSNKRSLFRAA